MGIFWQRGLQIPRVAAEEGISKSTGRGLASEDICMQSLHRHLLGRRISDWRPHEQKLTRYTLA
jgi:hypothetical protein